MATVTAEMGSGTVVDIQAHKFSLVSDEPEAAGGTDTGPTPYEILLSSLAACTVLTLRLYADHKGIRLDNVKVTLTFDRIHADDCEDCDERLDGRIERIQTRVVMSGEFDDAQRARLTQVAQRCPVHKTLANGLHISDSVSFE